MIWPMQNPSAHGGLNSRTGVPRAGVPRTDVSHTDFF